MQSTFLAAVLTTIAALATAATPTEQVLLCNGFDSTGYCKMLNIPIDTHNCSKQLLLPHNTRTGTRKGNPASLTTRPSATANVDAALANYVSSIKILNPKGFCVLWA